MSNRLYEVNLYNMRLHEIISVRDKNFQGTITRVPGGWIYERDIPDYRHSTATFVPYDNEFQKGGRNYE